MIVEPGRRAGLRRLAGILIGYGIVGLVVAALGIYALAVGLGRIDSLAVGLEDNLGGLSTTLERTATVLDDAAATAGGFGATIDSSTTALSTAAGDIRSIVPRLRDLEAQANALNILGSQPLAPIGGLFGQIAGQLSDLDAQLDGVATSLGSNRAALTANATSLTALATETRTLGGGLDGASLAGVVGDARLLLVAMLGIGAVGAAVPAVGALIVGLWLRRELRPPSGRH
ncbi:MAG TPA: hypothetical protein VM427_05280 [Patescibacteria group bacterium]|nr:hypothetical protein [Patescibacteria group bacterium]